METQYAIKDGKISASMEQPKNFQTYEYPENHISRNIDLLRMEELAQINPAFTLGKELSQTDVTSPQLQTLIDLPDDRIFGKDEFAEQEKNIFTKVKEEYNGKNQYHNPTHMQEVAQSVEYIANSYDKYRQVSIPQGLKQLLKIAAYFHDIGHPGHTLRQKATGHETDPYTNEEYSAMLVDNWTKENNLSLRQRALLYGLILATSFGDPQRKTHPDSVLEELMVIADSANLGYDFKDFLRISKEFHDEGGDTPRDETGLIKSRLGYIAWFRNTKVPELKATEDIFYGLYQSSLDDKENTFQLLNLEDIKNLRPEVQSLLEQRKKMIEEVFNFIPA